MCKTENECPREIPPLTQAPSDPFPPGLQPLRDVGQRRLRKVPRDVRHAGNLGHMQPGLRVQREARERRHPRGYKGVRVVGPGQQDREGGSDR